MFTLTQKSKKVALNQTMAEFQTNAFNIIRLPTIISYFTLFLPLKLQRYSSELVIINNFHRRVNYGWTSKFCYEHFWTVKIVLVIILNFRLFSHCLFVLPLVHTPIRLSLPLSGWLRKCRTWKALQSCSRSHFISHLC
jgi:hypothetical protein